MKLNLNAPLHPETDLAAGERGFLAAGFPQITNRKD